MPHAVWQSREPFAILSQHPFGVLFCGAAKPACAVGQKKFDELVEREIKGNWLKDGETLETAVEAYKSSAENEVIAQLCEAMLNKESAIKAFAKRNTAAAERIRDHIKSFLHMIRDAVKDAQEETDVSTLGDEYIHDMTGCLEKWSKAIDDAVKEQEQEKKQNAKARLDALTEKARTNKQDGVEHMQQRSDSDRQNRKQNRPDRDKQSKASLKQFGRNNENEFSIKKFSKEVDAIIYSDDRKPFNFYKVYLGQTPENLQKLGLDDLPLLMGSKHIYLCSRRDGRFNGSDDHYHNLGAHTIKKIPALIADPVLVYRQEGSTSNNNAKPKITIITQDVDKNGKPIMVAIEVSGQTQLETKLIYSNFIATAYGKKMTGLIEDIRCAFKDGRILYANEQKRSQMSPSGLWSQCPPSLWRSDFTDNINEFISDVKRFRATEKQRKKANDIIKKYNNDFSLRTEIGELTQQVAKMTDEQLNELYSLGRNKKGWYFKDISRVLDTVAGENKELRDMLHDVIEAPHSRATGLYAKSYRKSVEAFKKEMERLNVYDKKSGRYIQIYGEGHYQGACAVDIARVGADEFHVNAVKDGKTVLEGRFSYDDLIHYFSETNAERMLDALGESNAQIMPSSRGRWCRCCRGTHRSGRTKTRARNWRSC